MAPIPRRQPSPGPWRGHDGGRERAPWASSPGYPWGSSSSVCRVAAAGADARSPRPADGWRSRASLPRWTDVSLPAECRLALRGSTGGARPCSGSAFGSAGLSSSVVASSRELSPSHDPPVEGRGKLRANGRFTPTYWLAWRQRLGPELLPSNTQLGSVSEEAGRPSAYRPLTRREICLAGGKAL